MGTAYSPRSAGGFAVDDDRRSTAMHRSYRGQERPRKVDEINNTAYSILTASSPVIISAALTVALAVAQIVLDLSGAKVDPVVSDAFRLSAGGTISLLTARHIAIHSRSNGGN